MDLLLPFKVGDAAELRSFESGYRGAWFRCKITEMDIKQGHLECQMECIDFPDEKKSWSRLFQIPPGSRKQSRQIMVRPYFPQWYWENEIPEHIPNTDIVAVVSRPWKVGDLIDFWYTGCYWTGRIIKLLGDDKVKIDCPKKPFGEGGCYDADCKDLRPALDWSLEKGWSVPLSQENGECWYTARLITQNPDTGNSSSDEDIEQFYDASEEVLSGAPETAKDFMDSDINPPPNEDGKCCMNCQANSPTPMVKPEEPSQVLTNGQTSPTSSKKRKAFTEHASAQLPDTVSGAIMKLAKLANRISLVKDIVQSAGSATPNTAKPCWKFPEEDASAECN